MTEYSEIVIEYIKHYTTKEQLDIIGENIDYVDVIAIYTYCEYKLSSHNIDKFPLKTIKELLVIIGNMFDVLSKAHYKYRTFNEQQYIELEDKRMQISNRISNVLEFNGY